MSDLHAASASEPRIGRLTAMHKVLDWTPQHVVAAAAHPNVAKTIPMFSTSVTDGASVFDYTMVGSNPFIAQRRATTKVKVLLVPLVIKFSNGDTWDPTAKDSCDSESVLTRTKDSPIFKAQSWSFGGTSVGNDQYVDAFQRAEFWSETNPTGINPGYNLDLKLKMATPFTLSVPNADAAEGTTVCGSGLLGAVEVNYLDAQLQTYLSSVTNSTKEFVFFLMNNVVMYNVKVANCCILGFHNSETKNGVFQTYGIGLYDNTGDFSGNANISDISHEVAEWVNDPAGTNPTDPWGDVGQVSAGSCQSNLEVGDPLTGTILSDTVGGYTYNPQELAFFGWFYHSSASLGINGWYSDNDTFKVSAKACPPGGP